MVLISFPSAEHTTAVVDGIRGAIGRMVDFYVVDSQTACTHCNLDPTTGYSDDSFCIYCSGMYWIKTYSGISMSGHVWWNKADVPQYPTAGYYFDGDARVQIKYTESGLDVVNRTEYIVLDGKKMSIKGKVIRGVPELNRIILTLIEEERNDT